MGVGADAGVSMGASLGVGEDIGVCVSAVYVQLGLYAGPNSGVAFRMMSKLRFGERCSCIWTTFPTLLLRIRAE